MRTRWLLGAVLGALVLVTMGWAADPAPCDMTKVVKALYCGTDGVFLTKADLATKEHEFTCPECGKSAAKAGDCKKCDKPLDEHTYTKGGCKKCGTVPTTVEACEKTVFACSKCSAPAQNKGKCPQCKGAIKDKPAFALIKYACAACKGEGEAKAKCTTADCEREGKDLGRVCSASGTQPHVGPLRQRPGNGGGGGGGAKK